MIKWFTRNHNTTPADHESSQSTTDLLPLTFAEKQEPEKEGIFTRLKKGLSKTRHQLGDGVGRLLLGKKEIDQAMNN